MTDVQEYYNTFKELVSSVIDCSPNQRIVFVQRTDSSGKFIQVCYVLRSYDDEDLYMPNPITMLPFELDEDTLYSIPLEYLDSELPFLWVEKMIQEGHDLGLDRFTRYD